MSMKDANREIKRWNNENHNANGIPKTTKKAGVLHFSRHENIFSKTTDNLSFTSGRPLAKISFCSSEWWTRETFFSVSFFFSLFVHESLVSSFYRLLCASTLLTCLSGLPCVFVRFLSLIIIFVLFLDIQLKQLHINRLNFRFYFYSNSLQLVIKLQPLEHLDQTSAIVLCLSYFVYFLQLPGLRSWLV